MAKKNIVVISAETPYQQIVYVESITPKDDGKVQVGTTFDSNQAHAFATIEEARELLPKIFNPWERNYVAHEIQVERRSVANRQMELK